MTVELKVAPCDTKAARYSVENWHYSRTLPVGKLVKFGAWEDGQFVGSVMYAWGANHHLAGQFGLDMVECCELVRVALRSHHSPVSQIVAATLPQLKRLNPGVRLVVSFADPFQGHHGGIYQAGNWVYTGRSASKTEFIMPDGTMLNRRAYTGQQFGGGRSSVGALPRAARRIKVPGKHRYVYPLDRAMRRQVAKLAQQYPPRDSGLDGETAAFQAEGPGSTPGNRSRNEAAS
jgi:hypothetical protein